MDGCGQGCGWKMKGSETSVDGCGRVWTGVWMEDGGERDWVWMGVRLGADWVWTGVWMEDEGGRDDCGGKGGRCGWTEAVYEACFGVSLKHASLSA